MSDLELCFMPATEIALRIRRRELSPVEVVRNALARLDDTEPKLNAFVHRDDSGALAAAKDTERLAGGSEEASPLLGVPVSVKDLIDVAGMPCRHGSLALAGNTPSHDAPSVARLRAAGAIIIGKTATSEFGLRGYTESLVHGVTRSPWDTSRTPGGSSGGAAASAAAGVTPIALGTDGGGSIRSPSALTGLIGIKPQFGRVPIFPPSATPNLAHVGPVARNSADAALLLSIISGPDQRDWTSLQQPVGDIAKNTEGLRIAFSPTLGYAKVAAEVAECVNDAVRKLSTEFSQVEEVAFVCEDAGPILSGEFVAGVGARVDELGAADGILDPPTLRAIEAFRSRPATWLAGLQRARLKHRETLRRFFERFDILLTPTTPVTAWPVGASVPPGYDSYPSWSFFTYPFNLTGQPAATLPCGMSRSGLPIGLQIVVPPQREDLLVVFLAAAEQCLGWARGPPFDA